jgi:quercetin dioxygenase-like cupin family protein
MHPQVSVPSVVQSISQPWTPKLIAAVNNHEIKVAKISGAFIWHSHPNSDELFYVLGGEMTLEIEGSPAVQLQKGGLFVVPRGVRHRPVADTGAEILMVEMEGTINTGDVEGSGLTVVPEDIRGKTE